MNYCRMLPILVSLVGTGLPVEAATLKGFIRANELTGPPVPNVRVVAVGATTTATDDSGKFTLEFPAGVPGQMVTLSVGKAGHVTVNEVQLCWPLPKDPDAKPLVLLLCQEDVREEMARRFYRLKSFEAIEVAYQNRLKKLKELPQATSAELAKLGTERDQAKAAVENAVEELVHLQRSSSPGLYHAAMRLFLAGKVSDVLKILDANRLRPSAQDAKKEPADVIQMSLLRATLLTTQLRFEEADGAYKEAMAAAPESPDAWFAYAVFNQILKRPRQALPAYQRCEYLARRSEDKVNLAVVLGNLGLLYHGQNRMQEARRAYAEALEILRQLARQDPETYLPDVAMIQYNLGILQRDQNRMDDARQAYEEALRIYRQLAQQNPEFYLPSVASTLNNLGRLHHDQNRMEDARQAFEEALKIYRQLAQRSPETHLPDVALTLHSLGNLHRDQDRMEAARQAYEEALKIYRRSARQNPATYLPNVARILISLGNLYHDQGHMQEAHKAYAEALEILRQLAQQNPETCLPDVALTLNNLGILYSNQHRTEEARKAYEEALEIYKDFARRAPERYGHRLVQVQRLLKELKD